MFHKHLLCPRLKAWLISVQPHAVLVVAAVEGRPATDPSAVQPSETEEQESESGWISLKETYYAFTVIIFCHIQYILIQCCRFILKVTKVSNNEIKVKVVPFNKSSGFRPF